MQGLSSLLLIVVMFSTPWVWAQRAYRPGEVIVKLKGQQMGVRSNAFVGKAVSSKAMTLKNSWREVNIHQFALKAGDDVQAKIRELSQDPDVEFAEPNYILTKASIDETASAVDNELQAQAVTSQSAGYYGLSSAPIHAAETWPSLKSDSSYIIVAVIDTGLDLTHPVFVQTGSIWTNPSEIANNGIDDDHNGYIDDVHGWNWAYGNNDVTDDDSHGTHVAGTVLGVTQNIFVGSGNHTQAKIRIMPLKFLDSGGSGAVSDAIQAIYYAVNNGAKVLNNSWGGTSYSYALRDAVAFAYARETLFVAAAGNNTQNNDVVGMYPANYDVPNVISIASTTSTDAISWFSNFGTGTVHLASPGSDIYSTVPGGFTAKSGTSMATPIVSGIAAMMVRERPSMKGYQLKQLLISSATNVSGLSSKVKSSARVDSLAAVTAAKAAVVATSQPVYTASAGSDEVRAPASQAPAGCGLVTKLAFDAASGGGKGSGPSPLQTGIFAFLLLLPFILNLFLRRMKSQPSSRRQYERFRVDSEVRVRVGDQELVGQVSSLSMGGVQLDTQAMLDQGGVVTLSIRAPNGEEIKVDGQIVWSDRQQHYGVQFAQAQESVLSIIREWTRSLARQS